MNLLYLQSITIRNSNKEKKKRREQIKAKSVKIHLIQRDFYYNKIII